MFLHFICFLPPAVAYVSINGFLKIEFSITHDCMRMCRGYLNAKISKIYYKLFFFFEKNGIGC